ncbi:NnrS family protein [Enterovirga rhinocerotis]|uniref:Uncharacterized protein involved in response to NO n=1 Tax=Enterovirga rhinocerotis TaxID=1339210 RepID=A0A4R7BJ59_9HYPH|nr:NnrS family protein [Enterovirga rhinocerotis]TDR85364.1 uncharacterized protein involved in response to NO [Enterovirga rhinocerotis]
MSARCHDTGTPASGPQILSEGLRLFFPAAAGLAVLSPLVWASLFGLGLPFGGDVPPSQWHAHEMLFGVYAAALAGFLTSAVAEWTDTPARRGRHLVLLFALWLPGRLVGLLGLAPFTVVAGLTDLAFLGLLFWYVVSALIARGSSRHSSFALWIGLLWLAELGIRLAWLTGRIDLSGRLLHAVVAVFVIFFSLALARINVVVINLALDPSGKTSRYRPHPGRQNLTAGLVALYAVAAFAAPDSAAPAYLALAAGAAFFDRLAEWFIGRAVLRSHVLALGGATALAGIGFTMIGLAGLGAPIAPNTGYHVLSVACLGLAVLAVFVIAGLRHTGQALDLPWQAHAAFALMALAAAARVLPEIGLGAGLAGTHYLIAALLWSAAFGIWLWGFLPALAGRSDDASS